MNEHPHAGPQAGTGEHRFRCRVRRALLRSAPHETQAVAEEGTEEGQSATRRQRLDEASEGGSPGERDHRVEQLSVVSFANHLQQRLSRPQPGGARVGIVRHDAPEILDGRILAIDEGGHP